MNDDLMLLLLLSLYHCWLLC